VTAYAGPGEIVQMRGDAMRRQNRQPFAARVDKSHHREFVWRIAIWVNRLTAPFVAVVERRFVTVMSVRDDQFLIGHRVLDC